MGTRVVLLGLDGLDFRVLDPLIAQGLLPHFAKLKKEGTWGELRSTIPPASPMAWNSIATGLSPAKHGIFDFFHFSWARREARLATRRRRGKAIWEILSANGRRVIVVNIPCTYPPDMVNGLMISGFMSPPLSPRTVFPSGFYGRLKRIVPGYEIEVAEDQGPKDKDNNSDNNSSDNNGDGDGQQAYIEAIERNTRHKMCLLEYCLEREDWDLIFFVLEGPDRLQHKLWPEIITGRPRLVRYYQLLDSVLALAWDYLTDEDILMVVSDHGFRPIEGRMFLNEFFVRHGLLRFRRGPFIGNLILKRYLIPALKALRVYGSSTVLNHKVEAALRQRIRGPMLLRMMDWDNSTLLALTDTGVVYTTDGISAEALAGLRDRLQELSQVDRVYTRAEAFGQGPFLEEAPGLVFTDGRSDLRYEITRIERPASDRCAVHAPLGIFLAWGSKIKSAHRLEGAEVYDIAPTILHIMRVPIPRELDGVVLDDIFAKSG